MARDNDAATRIREAAAQLLKEGDGEFGMTGVAKRAGVSVGLAYHHFGSKAGLIGALITEFYDRYDAVTNQKYDRSLPWREREQIRLRDTVEFFFSDPLASVILHRLSGSAEVMAAEDQRRRQMIAYGAENLRRAQARGEVKDVFDAEIAAAVILGGLRQAMIHCLDDPNRPSIDDISTQLWTFVETVVADPA